MPIDSSKTVILVTGSNSGIGFDAVASLASVSSDYHVFLCSRSPDKGKKALEDIKARPNIKGSVALLQLDVTSAASIAAAVQRVADECGRLDVLINNAGIVSTAPTQSEQMRETFETNTIGPAAITEAFTPLLKKSAVPGGARLIYVSSGLGSIGLHAAPGDPYAAFEGFAYRTSKAALNMLTVCHHSTLQSARVKVWAMCPGYVVTNLTGAADRENRLKSGALSSETSAQTLLSIVQGKRDADVGKFVHKDGVYPW